MNNQFDKTEPDLKKRQLIKAALSSLCLSQFPHAFAASGQPAITKLIPSSGQSIPVIGMGTWQTFNVGNNKSLREKRCEVLKTFFEYGGGMIDSSPMYGSSEAVVGYCLKQLGFPAENFSATKVWSSSVNEGIEQFNDSLRLWQLDNFDLLQVHNLLGWQEYLPYLEQWKAEGKIKYIGMTTSHGRRHTDMEKILQNETIDFVQLTYNIIDRQAEARLLPLAKERGIAIIVNRPFRGGELFGRVKNSKLPDFAKGIGCTNWAQFFLKFIVSHPAVTCTIPATSSVDHMTENMGARFGPMPDNNIRQKMIDYVRAL